MSFTKSTRFLQNIVTFEMLCSLMMGLIDMCSAKECYVDSECDDFCDETANMCLSCVYVCVEAFNEIDCKTHCIDLYRTIIGSSTLAISAIDNDNITPAPIVKEAAISSTTTLLIACLCVAFLIIGVIVVIFWTKMHGRASTRGESGASSISSLESPIYRRVPITTPTQTSFFAQQEAGNYDMGKAELAPGQGQEPGPGMKLMNHDDPFNRNEDND